MEETQTLLSTTRKSLDDGIVSKVSRKVANLFTKQRRYSEHDSDRYESLGDHVENVLDDSSVGFLQLFRYADWIDIVLTLAGWFFSALGGVCFITSMIIFAKLTGTLVEKVFTENCYVQQKNASITKTSNIQCPLGINIHSSNYDRFERFCHNVSTNSSHILISDMSAFRAKKISYFDLGATSQLNSKLFDNIDKIGKGIGFELAMTVDAIINAIFGIGVAIFLDWKLSLIMLCLIPLVIVGSSIFSKFVAKETINQLKAYSKADEIVQEVFSSLRTVLSLNGGKFEKKRYQTNLLTTRESNIRKGIALGIFFGWNCLILYVIYFVGFITGSYLTYTEHEKGSIGNIIAVVMIFAQDISFIGYVGPFLQSLAEARAAATAVYRLIEEENITEMQILDEYESGHKSTDINGDIQFENVNFAYPARKDVEVIRHLDLVARAGETTALVGKSGSGKSTTISLLLRFYEPILGHIKINNQLISDYNIKNLRQNIGIVSQEPYLFGTSIYNNILYGKEDASNIEIEEAAKQANAHDFIMTLPNKYETLVGESGVQLSGGEKQRIALARALVKQPALLLLDEATSALDNVSRTTIVVSHRLSTIRNAHQIYVFDNGTVIEHGTHETLMANEGSAYQELFQTQQKEHMESDNYQSTSKICDEKQTVGLPWCHSDEQNTIKGEKRLLSNRWTDFRRLVSMNSPEKIAILIGCFACLAAGVTQPICVVLLAKIIQGFESCTSAERQHQVLIFSIIFLLLGVATFAIRFLQFTAFAVSGSKLTERIRVKTFECLLRQEVAYFDRPENSCGAVCTRLSSDGSAVQQMTGPRLGIFCETFSMFLIAMILGFFYSWQIACIVFLCILLICVLGYINIRVQDQLSKHSGMLQERAGSLAVEVLHNMRTIKQLTIEDVVLQQYSDFIWEKFRITRNYSIIIGLIMSGIWAMIAYNIAIIYWCVLVLIEHNEMKMNDIIKVFAFAMFFIQSIRSVLTMIEDFGTSLSAIHSFFELFDRTPLIDNGSTTGQELVDFRGQIDFVQVNFSYPTRSQVRVLNNFQLSIQSGQRIALVGVSGSGKSTVIQLLERFYDVTNGKLCIDGVDIRQLNIHWVRSCFGLVSQEPILFDLTIAENIAYSRDDASIIDIIDAATKANIHEFIQNLPEGYQTRVGRKGSQLSGGQKQRIAIARALFRRPKVLLLDEATSAMDSHNEKIVQKVLEEIQTSDPHQASLIIAHRLSTIRSCDLIGVLDKGYLVECDTHNELMQRRAAYYRMVSRDSEEL
ncbi:unnamed protein product [Rotaria socialis]|uniref:Uncharacterized protein n=1 Tax=Rotaria socialis TaxID=392032 RepID=A0A817YIH5_9BILA|nr:unnamed protein product [Rotaria socialis]